MGTIYYFTSPGADGGTWHAATYPLGATRYYANETARERAVRAYCDAIEATGGAVFIDREAQAR